MILSYSPTTNEAQAMEKLNVSAEVIKKLKKQNILKYAGHLICNRSIEEYIKGGKGYHDSLQIALQMRIEESVKKQYEEQTFFKNVGVQYNVPICQDHLNQHSYFTHYATSRNSCFLTSI